MVQRILLAGWLLLGAWGTLALTHPPAAHARAPTVEVLHHLAPTAVVSYGGVVAWSVKGADGRYRLTIRHGARGAPRAVPIAPSHTAFDVDLGPGPGGHVWAAFSRCAGSPRRCTLRGADLATGRERRIGGNATGRLPSIWGDELAYFGPERHHRSPLRLTGLSGGADHAIPLHTVAEAETPLALDLRDSRIAYVLRTYEDGDAAHDTQDLIAARTDGSAQRTLDTGGDGEECTTNLASPALGAAALIWLHASVGDRGTCSPHPTLRQLDLGSGTVTEWPVATAPVAATLVEGRALVLAPPPGTADVFTREACDVEGRGEDRCTLTDAGAPAWSPAPH
jgi:hypothetical protein